MTLVRNFIFIYFFLIQLVQAQNTDGIYPGADEKTPSRSEYFSWINNTNEGATEAHTLINLNFFQWLQNEYGMKLDIYAFDAGAIDGKRFYGSRKSDRFKQQFPNGFGPVYEKAKNLGIRLGVWGGPDGFGNNAEEEKARIEEMTGLCRDYNWALFKFDAVCGPLRPEKEAAFIKMMKECRQYSPDLILLNHRLGLEKAQQYATTFLWEGRETYVGVFSVNNVTAPHHRANALNRGLVPNLQRLTEDHGVCITSYPDYWDDDLILQAFNRSLILSPQIYGNPWLLRDEEFAKLARIFNLHRKYKDILVNGLVLPAGKYGPAAVSRGDADTRFITLRNLTWKPVTYQVQLDEELGLSSKGRVELRQLHPVGRLIGRYKNGTVVEVEVPSFRACLLIASTEAIADPAVEGCDYEVIRNVKGKSLLIDLLGRPGTRFGVSLQDPQLYISARIKGKNTPRLLRGKREAIRFGGTELHNPEQRKLADLQECSLPADAAALYDATVFAADNNALELRALKRSGTTEIPAVKAAREAFFKQQAFRERGVNDRNLFDDDLTTGFWPARKYGIDQKIKGGCFRLDLGEIRDIDELVIQVPDDYSLQPLLTGEGNYAYLSPDLKTWKRVTYLAAPEMRIGIEQPFRYLKLNVFPDRIVEINGFKDGLPVNRSNWRATNLFARTDKMTAVKAWKAVVEIDEMQPGGYFCVAIKGEHGKEGAYAAIKMGEKYYGAPDRASAFQSNTWEYINARRSKNYTYYIPLNAEMVGKKLEVWVLAYDENKLNLEPEVWMAGPVPWQRVRLELKTE